MDRRYVVIGISLVVSAVLFLIAVFVTGNGSALQGEPTVRTRLVVVGISMVLGGTLLPLYAVLVAHALDRTDPVYVPSTAITLLFVYTLGGVAGPVLVAVMSAAFNDDQMDWLIFLLFFGFSLFATWRITHRSKVPSAMQVTMSPATGSSTESLVRQK